MGRELHKPATAKTRPSRSLTCALAWAFVAPLACSGGELETGITTASSTTASGGGSSATDGQTSTSGQTTGAGSTGAQSTQGTQDSDDTRGSETDDTDCDDVSCDPDLPSPPAKCDYQDELCPEGQKCSFDDELSQTACFDIDPAPDDVGEPCEGSGVPYGGADNCGDQAICWDGVCLPVCPLDDPWCFPGFSCDWCQECALGICALSCDPLIQDCPGDHTCVPSGEDFVCLRDASRELGAYLEPCELPTHCDPGLHCLSSRQVTGCEAAGCCTPWCDINEPSCPDALECAPWYEDWQGPGVNFIGICRAPQP